MNEWRRLYAHLAPILPDTVLLSRVEQLARTAAPPLEPYLAEADPSCIRGLINQMFAEADPEKLKRLTIQLEDEVALAAPKMNLDERSLITDRMRNTDVSNYDHVFRFYSRIKPIVRRN